MVEAPRGVSLSIDEHSIQALHLQYGISQRELTQVEIDSIHSINLQIKEGGPLSIVGQGGDMIAYSRPDLDFVLKFPYTESYPEGIKPRFSKRVEYGYFLGMNALGGILAPSMDVPFVLPDGQIYTVIIQEKVATVENYLRQLKGTFCASEQARIRKDFINLTEGMWERGVFDRDPSWEENYGVLIGFHRSPYYGMTLEGSKSYLKGQLVLIDIGHLSDDPADYPSYEGMERQRLYETSLRPLFGQEHFENIFGTYTEEAWETPRLVIPKHS